MNGLRSEERPGVREPLGKQYPVGIASAGVRVDREIDVSTGVHIFEGSRSPIPGGNADPSGAKK